MPWEFYLNSVANINFGAKIGQMHKIGGFGVAGAPLDFLKLQAE